VNENHVSYLPLGPSAGLGPFVLFTALLCAAAAARALLLRQAGGRRARLLFAGPPAPPAAGLGRWTARAWTARELLDRWPALRDPAVHCGAACPLAGLLLALWGSSPLPLLAGVAAAPWAVRRRRRREEERGAEHRRETVIAFCAALAGEVRAGRQPEQALLAAGVSGLGAPAAGLLAAARYGGDVPAALRRAAGRPGAEGLAAVAACWQVAVDGGASLATGLDRVAQSLRAERDQREELRSQLAGPRATALVLAALPLAGLLLGAAMGVQPLRVLLHTAPGLGCLAAGVALEWAGLSWASAIIRHAERSADT
jgi:tight adherence protein B